MLLRLLNSLLFLTPFMFAAGAPTLTDAGSGGGDSGGAPSADAPGVSETTETDEGYGLAELGDEPTTEEEPADGKPAAKPQTEQDDPDAAEFKGMVSARLKGFVKKAPELAQVFQKHPEIQAEFEARFRREAAYREIFPTVAEARQLREALPNGLADLGSLNEQIGQLDALDKDFYSRDEAGNYSGHTTLLNNMFSDDREATISLFKTMPKEWARLDRDSYNEVMGEIVGATFAQRGLPEFVGELVEAAKEAKQDGLAKELGKLANWINGYLKGKPEPTEAERRVAEQQKQLDRQKADRAREDGQRFGQTFVAESRRLQLEVVNTHPAMQRLVKANVPEAKRKEIAEKIRSGMEKFLAKSPSFMRKLKPAYEARNLEETKTLQKAAWSQPWLLNRFVRSVLATETPNLIQNSRATTGRAAAATKKETPARGEGAPQRPTKPYKVGGRWYKATGEPFTTAELLAGKHEQ